MKSNKTEDYIVYDRSDIDAPDLSIIVPVYNMAGNGYLKDFFNSLYSGGQVSFELICVDNCSTDNTLQILKDYAQKKTNMTLLSMKRNSKQGAARNRGLDVAQGRYIGFMDPDDFISPGYYKSLVEYADKHKCDVVASSYQYTNELGHPDGKAVVPYPASCLGLIDQKSLKEILLLECPICSCIYLRSIFESADSRFPEHVYFEDNAARIHWKLKFCKLGQVPDAVYYWRRYNSSTTALSLSDPSKIKDRIITSRLILTQAKADGYYYQYQEELDFLFIRLGVFNTLNSMWKLGKQTRKQFAAEVKALIKSNVPHYYANIYIRKLPFVMRAKYLLCCWSPNLALKMMDLLNIFKKH